MIAFEFTDARLEAGRDAFAKKFRGGLLPAISRLIGARDGGQKTASKLLVN